MMRAFTLIELLIVIVIIGILAVSLVPRLTGAQDRARITGIKALLNQAYTQAQIYHMNNGGTYAGLCNDTTIQGILGSLGGSGHAACYVHPNTITTIDWGIATTFKGRHYLAGPQGVMMLDSANTGGLMAWDDAMTACESQGKKLPSTSMLKALWNITSSAPNDLSAVYRSFTENPNDGTHAYRQNLGSNANPASYAKTNNHRVRCASTQ